MFSKSCVFALIIRRIFKIFNHHPSSEWKVRKIIRRNFLPELRNTIHILAGTFSIMVANAINKREQKFAIKIAAHVPGEAATLNVPRDASATRGELELSLFVEGLLWLQ